MSRRITLDRSGLELPVEEDAGGPGVLDQLADLLRGMDTYLHEYVYIYIYIYTLYIVYIYIYRERGREREKGRERDRYIERERERDMWIYIYIYIYIEREREISSLISFGRRTSIVVHIMLCHMLLHYVLVIHDII